MDIDINHIARLAKLQLTDDEKTMLAQQLPQILDYVSKLQEVDTSGVAASAYLTDAVNVFRADVAEPVSEVQRRALIASFPKRGGELLQVPGVFE